MKKCKKCDSSYPPTTEYFHKLPRNKDGLSGQCKVCKADYDKVSKTKEYKDTVAKEKAAAHASMVKKCSDCGNEFPRTVEYFSVREDSKDGLRGQCRECYSASHRVYYIENTEAIMDKNKRYVEDHKEAVTAYKHSFYLTHATKYIEKQRVYQVINIEAYRKYQNSYAKTHLEPRRIHCQRYRSRKRKLPSTLTVKQWEGIKNHFNNECCYCGEKRPLQQEHFLAVTKDGEYATTNIVPACGPCNVSKSNHSFFEWYPKRKSYTAERETKILKFLGYKNQKQQLCIF